MPAPSKTLLHFGKEPFPGYRLEELLAQGPYSEVWKSSTTGGTNLALKFIPCANSTAAAREVRAIGVVQRLQHPGLTRVYTIWTNRGYIVVAMELADGSLLDLLDAYQTEYGRPPTPATICGYLTQAAEAIDFLNTRQHQVEGALVGIQHCAIKPSNLLLFGETVKLVDFGLATPISTSTKPHRRAGTRGFAAPEVWQGLLSERTDQYALGVAYCQLRTGRLPFPEDASKKHERLEWEGDARTGGQPSAEDATAAQVKAKHPSADLSSLPAAERSVVARAVAPAPPDRWPSCREFMAQLSKVAR